MGRYEVAFSGEMVAGAQPELVKANVAKVFQADAQRIALLFSGRRIVIKSNLDAAAAEKYRETLARAGALVEVRSLDEEVEEIELAAPPEPAVNTPSGVNVAPAPGSAGRLKVAPRDEYMAAFIDVDAPNYDIAPLGNDLQDVKPDPEAPAVDLSQFSLAPVGSDMGQAKEAAPSPPPDTSHIKLQ